MYKVATICLKYPITCLLVAIGLLPLLASSQASDKAESTLANQGVAKSQLTDQADESARIAELSLQMFTVQGPDKVPFVKELASFGDKNLIPTFVLAMRLTGSNVHVAKALSDLTGETITTWHEAYQWQERHPDIVPHESFRALKLRFLGSRDEQFLAFFAPPYGNRDQMRIRLEEVVWGGVQYDGIPPLDNPDMVNATDADYLIDSDLVFGIEINGDARAYPLRIMGWHEMANDVIGGIPVALAYCTLCGSGILFDTQLNGAKVPIKFGSSGLLYRSNKLMFDRRTNSLWNQFSGEPVVGLMANSDIKLKIRPITITTWEAWLKLHADTTVLSLQTGYSRNYDSGFVYKEYFASPDLMFPAHVQNEQQLARKDYVFGVRSVAASKAWPLHVFAKKSVINDQVGLQSLVLIGDASARTVRAFERQPDEEFAVSDDGTISTDASEWELTENFLVSANGKQMRARLPGHISYWFAWENFMGVKSELYQQ